MRNPKKNKVKKIILKILQV